MTPDLPRITELLSATPGVAAAYVFGSVASDLREQRFVEHTLQIAIQAALELEAFVAAVRRRL